MRRPRILLTYPFPLGHATGGARMTREIARHLARAGAEVTILPVSSTALTCFPRPALGDKALGLEFDAELAEESVTIERVSQHPLHWILDGAAVRKAVKKVLARRDPDIVLSYYHEAAFLPALLEPRGIKLGFISTWQSYEHALGGKLRKVPRFMSNQVQRRMVIKPHRRAAIFFATSHFTRHELIDVVGIDEARIVVCPLGVAPHFFDVPREKPEKIRNILFVGRIVPQKGIDDAISAFAQLVRRGHHDLTLRVIGQGDHGRAKALAAEHGVTDRVEVLPAVDDKGLRDEFRSAHIALLPSHFEAFGLCFAEAQATGLPIVAYDAGSVPEIVEQNVTGKLAPNHDVDALGNCLEQAIRDPATTHAMALAGRARARRTYKWELTAETMLRGIGRVCGTDDTGHGDEAPAAQVAS